MCETALPRGPPGPPYPPLIAAFPGFLIPADNTTNSAILPPSLLAKASHVALIPAGSPLSPTSCKPPASSASPYSSQSTILSLTKETFLNINLSRLLSINHKQARRDLAPSDCSLSVYLLDESSPHGCSTATITPSVRRAPGTQATTTQVCIWDPHPSHQPQTVLQRTSHRPGA